jgi:ferrous iron transport protein B
MGVLYQAGDTDDDTAALQTKLQQQTYKSGPHKGEKVFSPLVAFSMMIFVLIYMPCIAAITAIKKEGGRKWAILTGCYTTALAWLMAFAVFQIGSLFI